MTISTRFALVCALSLAGTGCGSDNDKESVASTAASPVESTDQAADDVASPTGAFVLLDIDPCPLLTMTEMEAAIGSGVEQGGFGEDSPGRCTYSIGGDVGAGAVAISIGDPLVCAAIQRGIEGGGTAAEGVVDVGGGGLVQADGGSINFLVGGGCIGISGSSSGESLDEDALVALGNAAAGRVG